METLPRQAEAAPSSKLLSDPYHTPRKHERKNLRARLTLGLKLTVSVGLIALALSLTDLGRNLRQRVRTLTDNRQTPRFHIPATIDDFDIYRLPSREPR